MFVFEWARGRKFHLVVNHTDNRVSLCLGTISLVVGPWTFDVFKTICFIVPRKKHSNVEIEIESE